MSTVQLLYKSYTAIQLFSKSIYLTEKRVRPVSALTFQRTFTWSKSTIEAPEKSVKYVQS